MGRISNADREAIEEMGLRFKYSLEPEECPRFIKGVGVYVTHPERRPYVIKDTFVKVET